MVWVITHDRTYALVTQDLSYTYLAHCELENVKIIITMMMIIDIVVVIAILIILIIIVIHKTLHTIFNTIVCIADKMPTSRHLGINH